MTTTETDAKTTRKFREGSKVTLKVDVNDSRGHRRAAGEAGYFVVKSGNTARVKFGTCCASPTATVGIEDIE